MPSFTDFGETVGRDIGNVLFADTLGAAEFAAPNITRAAERFVRKEARQVRHSLDRSGFAKKHPLTTGFIDRFSGRKPKRANRGRTAGTTRSRSILDRATPAGKRSAERPFDARGQKTSRKLDFDPPPPGGGDLHLQKTNMPHGRSRRTSMRSRGNVKSHSRNIRSNISISRPMQLRARRNQYAEVKDFTALATLVVDGSILPIANIPQGTTSYTRIGDDLKIAGLNLNYRVHLHSAVLPADVTDWRFTVIQWLPSNVGNPPTKANIFLDVPTGRPGFQMFNKARRPTFKVLYDASGILTGNAALPVTGNTTTGLVKLSLNVPNKVLTFSGASTNGTNQIYVLFQTGSSNAGATNFALCDYNWRTTFIDS